jgi:hypothetical protein
MTLPAFPPEVISYIRNVFAKANRRISEKIARVPNCSEPSLDLTFIEHLTQFAAPRVVAPGWTVKLDVHFLGGLRHFHRWEIADIGLLVFAKQGTAVVAQKVALLQSKRLYPSSQGVIEETLFDYQVGFANLLPGGPSAPLIGKKHQFKFTEQSKYGALHVNDEQYSAIEQYEADRKTPVHYLLYNPWKIPATYQLPESGSAALGAKANGGARVIPSALVRKALQSKSTGYSPSFDQLSGLCGPQAVHAAGWRLEHFVADLVMTCRQGRSFTSINEDQISSLFFRRSGPIAAALAITVEGPGSD